MHVVGQLFVQGRSLTMGREGPGPPVFGSDYSKIRVGPLHFFRIKGPNIILELSMILANE